MKRKEVRAVSEDLAVGFVVLASDKKYKGSGEGQSQISGNFIYQADDDSLAHDLFAPARLMYYESLGNKVRTVFIVISRALQGLIESEQQPEEDPDW